MTPNGWKRILYVMLIILSLTALLVLLLESNAWVKQPGSTLTQTVKISELEGLTGAGYALLQSNPSTPSFLASVAFSNGEQLAYFSVDEGESASLEVVVSLPASLETGVYYYDVVVVFEGEEYELTERVSVR